MTVFQVFNFYFVIAYNFVSAAQTASIGTVSKNLPICQDNAANIVVMVYGIREEYEEYFIAEAGQSTY